MKSERTSSTGLRLYRRLQGYPSTPRGRRLLRLEERNLTEIDVQATLTAKLNEPFGRYVILGACNPQLPQRALQAELGIGPLLPCNVCV
ncbi:MAG: DUF302 domain-containing protein [Acidobacteria bacterium]|nr:DUF302 domain-containing protein [Acidobacteriota bacterium]